MTAVRTKLARGMSERSGPKPASQTENAAANKPALARHRTAHSGRHSDIALMEAMFIHGREVGWHGGYDSGFLDGWRACEAHRTDADSHCERARSVAAVPTYAELQRRRGVAGYVHRLDRERRS